MQPFSKTAIPLALAIATLAVPAWAQKSRKARLLEDFQERRTTFLIEAGQRHLELGIECRDKGLVAQSAVQILYSNEISEGRNPGARVVLSYMRRLDDKFWKKTAGKPTKGKIDRYERKARKLRHEDLEERMDLARWASKKGFEEEAHREYECLLREHDGPLVFDEDGRLVTEVGTLPEQVSDRFRARAVRINGNLHLRDPFLETLEEWDPIFEVGNEKLRVRCQTGIDQAQALFELGAELLPQLEVEFGGRSERLPTVFVFSERKVYERYLDAAGLGEHRAADGLADNQSFVAVLSGENGASVDALFLHELTHLIDYGVSPSVMPSWYTEGRAETWGGAGTFTRQGGELVAGGMLDGERLAALKTEGPLPLREFLKADALELLQVDPEKAHRFYAQAWAWMRFLSKGVDSATSLRFMQWEAQCRGSALGAKQRRHRSRDATKAQVEFERLFAEDLGQLEAEFRAWIGEL